jgi:hypothetical protein
MENHEDAALPKGKKAKQAKIARAADQFTICHALN